MAVPAIRFQSAPADATMTTPRASEQPSVGPIEFVSGIAEHYGAAAPALATANQLGMLVPLAVDVIQSEKAPVFDPQFATTSPGLEWRQAPTREQRTEQLMAGETMPDLAMLATTKIPLSVIRENSGVFVKPNALRGFSTTDLLEKAAQAGVDYKATGKLADIPPVIYSKVGEHGAYLPQFEGMGVVQDGMHRSTLYGNLDIPMRGTPLSVIQNADGRVQYLYPGSGVIDDVAIPPLLNSLENGLIANATIIPVEQWSDDLAQYQGEKLAQYAESIKGKSLADIINQASEGGRWSHTSNDWYLPERVGVNALVTDEGTNAISTRLSREASKYVHKEELQKLNPLELADVVVSESQNPVLVAIAKEVLSSTQPFGIVRSGGRTHTPIQHLNMGEQLTQNLSDLGWKPRYQQIVDYHPVWGAQDRDVLIPGQR